MTQNEYWKQHRILSNEVTNTIQSFYTWLDVNNYAAENEVALARMNSNPTFWNITLHSLQTTFIITIGRVFDRDPRSYSLHKLLAETIAHPEYFSKEALARRKCDAAGGSEPDWLAEYLKHSWEPDSAALVQLRDALKPTIAKYEAVYQPIRHKMFAHKDIAVDTDALLGKSLIADVEQILYATHDILERLWQLAHNGLKPELGVQKYDYTARIRKTTWSVLGHFTATN